jgi:hypothetical protein
VEQKERVALSRPLSNLLEEVAAECRRALGLISEIRTEDLSVEQLDEKLSRLSTSAIYLHSHTCGLQDLINDEIEELWSMKYKREKARRKKAP